MRGLPVASAVIILIFAGLVFRRHARQGGAHLLVWGIGLAMFGAGSLAEAYSAIGWNPVVFRLWYLMGAMLNAAWLGQGTVYLLSGQRMGNLLVAIFAGFTLAVALAVPVGRAVPLVARGAAVVIAVLGLLLSVVLQRRWVRYWNPRMVTRALMIVLTAGSVIAATLVFTLPLHAARFSPGETLSAQYREILPRGASVRRLTPIFNIYGTLTLIGGALYSAWLLWRKEIVPHRVMGNMLIALGAFVIAGASTMVRLGLADYLYLGELLAAALMFAGFLLATARVTAGRPGGEAAPA